MFYLITQNVHKKNKEGIVKVNDFKNLEITG